MKAGEEGSTLARRTARARGGEISGEHRSDTPRGPSVPWMAPSEIGLAPCEAYSPTYLAQALPDTIRLLRKRGAWEMNDHEDIAALARDLLARAPKPIMKRTSPEGADAPLPATSIVASAHPAPPRLNAPLRPRGL